MRRISKRRGRLPIVRRLPACRTRYNSELLLQLNHLQGKAAASTTQEVVAALYALIEEGHIDQKQFAHIQVQLDWVQYKHNFREMVSASRPLCVDRRAKTPILDIRFDARQI